MERRQDQTTTTIKVPKSVAHRLRSVAAAMQEQEALSIAHQHPFRSVGTALVFAKLFWIPGEYQCLRQVKRTRDIAEHVGFGQMRALHQSLLMSRNWMVHLLQLPAQMGVRLLPRVALLHSCCRSGNLMRATMTKRRMSIVQSRRCSLALARLMTLRSSAVPMSRCSARQWHFWRK